MWWSVKLILANTFPVGNCTVWQLNVSLVSNVKCRICSSEHIRHIWLKKWILYANSKTQCQRVCSFYLHPVQASDNFYHMYSTCHDSCDWTASSAPHTNIWTQLTSSSSVLTKPMWLGQLCSCESVALISIFDVHICDCTYHHALHGQYASFHANRACLPANRIPFWSLPARCVQCFALVPAGLIINYASCSDSNLLLETRFQISTLMWLPCMH